MRLPAFRPSWSTPPSAFSRRKSSLPVRKARSRTCRARKRRSGSRWTKTVWRLRRCSASCSAWGVSRRPWWWPSATTPCGWCAAQWSCPPSFPASRSAPTSSRKRWGTWTPSSRNRATSMSASPPRRPISRNWNPRSIRCLPESRKKFKKIGSSSKSSKLRRHVTAARLRISANCWNASMPRSPRVQISVNTKTSSRSWGQQSSWNRR